MELPKRKPNRLRKFDYSKNGAYFITICTDNRQKILSSVAGETIGCPQYVSLSEYGKIVEIAIKNIPVIYPMITVDNYIIMPNHVHLILQIHKSNRRPLVAPTVSNIIQQMKGYASKKIGKNIWQKSFHDRVIRDREEYENISRYISYNPKFWKEDCFYIEDT